MLHDVIDYAFITSILYVYKTLQLSLSMFFHMFLHFIFLQYLLSAIIVFLQWKVLLTFINEY